MKDIFVRESLDNSWYWYMFWFLEPSHRHHTMLIFHISGAIISRLDSSFSGDSRRMSEVNIDSKLPTRKPSAANSASSSQIPSRNWSRHSSPTRGEILRMEDEMHTVNRGGVEMTIPLNITHHIPPKLLGQLDEEGILICDR